MSKCAMFRTKWVARMLFQTESDGDTPFGIMSVQCLRRLEQQRRQQLLDLMDTTLAHYSTTIPTPLHICDALVVAATEDNIHLDCVYYYTGYATSSASSASRNKPRTYRRPQLRSVLPEVPTTEPILMIRCITTTATT